MFYLISYDIINDKRRNKLYRILKDYGVRVQYSVFECILENKQFEKLIVRCKKVIDTDEDSIRIYRQCESCKGKIDIIGNGKVTIEDEILII